MSITGFGCGGRRLLRLAVAALAALTLTARSAAAEKTAVPQTPDERELVKVTFWCHWLPQAQFAGYYLAKEKGFYRQQGLDVEIMHGSPTVGNAAALIAGKADFASLFLTTAIRLRAEGAPIVNLTQLFRHSSLALVARRSSGIDRIADLNGRKIGIWQSDFRDVPLRFLEENRIRGEIVFMNNSVDMFLWGGVDVMAATVYNELHALAMSGLPPERLYIIRLKDCGMDIPEDGIYCREDYFRAHPELCRAFAAATVEGWRYALKHREEALDVVEKQMHDAHLPVSRVHQRWMLDEVGKLIFPDNRPDAVLPPLTPEDFRRTAELLAAAGRIATIPKFAEFRPDGGSDSDKRK